MDGKSIEQRWDLIRNKINVALKNSSRSLDSLKVVAVTKKQPIEKINDCISIGLCDFGENYWQECREKLEVFKNNHLNWHYIGVVQSKKVKDLIGHFTLWHGVDRWSVIEELNSRAIERPQDLLIQINIASESTKSGISSNELFNWLDKIHNYKGFRLCGLMTMPPLASDEKASRKHFENLRHLLEESQKRVETSHHPMNQLSMGTSQDYTWAIEEGATLIRLGEALLGPRV